MDELIQIIYIATGDYYKYATGFLSSIKYFMPGYRKIVTFITDDKQDYNIFKTGDIVEINRIHTCDLIYPSINLNKTKIVLDNIDYRCDYVFYFDADTKFMECNGETFETLKNDIDNNNLLLTKNPFESVPDSFIEHGLSKNEYMAAIIERNMCRNINSSCFMEFTDDSTYICSSFFCGKTNVVASACDIINRLIKEDLNYEKGYYIPPIFDESYFNKLYNSGDFTNIIVRQYNRLYVYPDNGDRNIFMYQKQIHDEYKQAKS